MTEKIALNKIWQWKIKIMSEKYFRIKYNNEKQELFQKI
jgi:hypothetical protein